MSDHQEKTPAPTVWPSVSFTDVDAGVRLLTEGLGFVVTALYRDATGAVQHAEARWPDGGGVMFGSRGKPGQWGALGPAGVYVVAAEAATVDAVRERVGALNDDGAEVEVTEDLHDTDYGSHQLGLRDRDGNLWTIGTYRGARARSLWVLGPISSVSLMGSHDDHVTVSGDEQAMSTQDSHDRKKVIAYYQSEPRPWEIKLRPVGYFLVTVVWVLLTLITLGLAAVLPLALSGGGTDPHMADYFSEQARDPANASLGVAVMVVLVGPVLGYTLVLLPLLTAPLAALSATYVVRSLRPSYRRERLSSTGWSRDTVGPVTVGPTALSLQAIRATRWTRFWMRVYSYSWGGGGAALFIQAPFTGLAYIVTVCWLLWPVHGVFVIAGWSLLSIALVTPGIVLAVRRTRRDREAKEARRPVEQERQAKPLSRSAES